MRFYKSAILILLSVFNASCVNTRYVEDDEWQSMSIEERVLNERRNECAARDDGTCIIFEND
ncbi:hypothetical protein [Photobacterium sp. J15]|uniref:hypothetical protein n=1 Tax=Photobacterium sp. J15 TaxID=265901 RepID=UPI000A5BC014|nr:hypothetical protein [Photobacterium sp. J15]